MCAIFGTVGTANLDLVKKISRKQIYRGPDQQDFYVSEDNLVCLGNNRLSVIDKLNGKQPMFSADKKFVTVFNGCVYNFLEIKKYLQKKNIKFFTNSDTEVVVNAYMYFGKKTFNYFDGMWAIAIYDQEKKELLLSRDYVGQKPLFYTKNSNYYLFSSQLDGIMVDDTSSKKISNKNLKKYFAYSFVPSPNTIFENIFQLEPGENIIIKSRNLNIDKKKYWDLKNGPDYNSFFSKINIENFKKEFNSVIDQHSISDKIPAILLSGGLDSYLITNYLVKSTKNYSSFTLGFENKSYDEAQYVKKIEKKVNKKIFYANESDFITSFKEISKVLNEPMGDSSIIPTYIIHKKIKPFSNVSHGGDGGDESFFGYITFDAFYLALKLKKLIPIFFLKLIRNFVNFLAISHDYLSLSTKLKKFFNSIHLQDKYLLPSWMSCLNINDMCKLFNETIHVEDMYSEVDVLFNSNQKLMRCSQLYFFKFYLPMILIKVDQAGMYNSVESRSPFLSKKILNFSLDEEVTNLYKPFKKKYLLKKIFNNEIPSKILKRKKHGFAFPKEKFLKNKNFIFSVLNKSLLTNKKFFEIKYNNFLNNTEDSSQYLWNELILNISLQNLLGYKAEGNL